MGEEVRGSEYDSNGGDEVRVSEWEMGLPSADDLTPLSQLLISPELASAFSISPEPRRSVHDVTRESRNTLCSIRATGAQSSTNNNNDDDNFGSFADPMVLEPDGDGSGSGSGSDARKMRKVTVTDGDFAEEADSAVRMENSDDPLERTLKRPRLVWTPQLHKRFVDVVAHLGIKNAVPKTIMQLMNVEGLTRENVASHLQKYRLYLKRMQGLSSEGPSSSDQLFDSSMHESGGGGNTNGHVGMPIHMPCGAPMMPLPIPAYGHMGMHQGGYHHPHLPPGFEMNPYGMMQQRDWSGNKYGSGVSYPHHGPANDKLN
ncbi:hypothetical protein SLEP1_g41482 [Rubroshorea leprosula]|uniref:HTH myb-type domain-containing protein n=1 Tax=Rubroshorea leprosula TaxID=152421 RepID=A0AAV5L6M5_9ROSI|nr:hypothetical protein SLEP1_g41482 [Rubroshorea leprosula]